MRDKSESVIAAGIVATLLTSWMIWVTSKLAEVSERTARIEAAMTLKSDSYRLEYPIKR